MDKIVKTILNKMAELFLLCYVCYVMLCISDALSPILTGNLFFFLQKKTYITEVFHIFFFLISYSMPCSLKKMCESSNKTFSWTSKGLGFETDIKAKKN